MYNVQLSEFWKQRVGKESIFNAPYLTGADDSEYDVASEAPSRAPSQLSTTSTVTQQKVRIPMRARPSTSPRPEAVTFAQSRACPRPHLILWWLDPHRSKSSRRGWMKSVRSAWRRRRCWRAFRRASADDVRAPRGCSDVCGAGMKQTPSHGRRRTRAAATETRGPLRTCGARDGAARAAPHRRRCRAVALRTGASAVGAWVRSSAPTFFSSL